MHKAKVTLTVAQLTMVEPALVSAALPRARSVALHHDHAVALFNFLISIPIRHFKAGQYRTWLALYDKLEDAVISTRRRAPC